MMREEIHGHAVMEMMVQAKAAYTKASLKAAILEKFGPEARFHTCSAANMTADELIDFLAERGKFIPQEGGFSTSPEKICQH
jgi:probable metal-binding protein